MGVTLYIAEKPSVAQAIASQLGNVTRGDGVLRCGNTWITWCFGHMLEQAEPDAYTPDNVPRLSNGKKVWRTDELPILPKRWLLLPKSDAKKQLTIIGRLLKEASEVVNAGDPDREGQLLVDEVLEHFSCKLPVRRFWVSAQDAVSIQRGLNSLKNNRDYVGMAEAARARQRADWLIGMNFSRAYTLRAARGGSRALLTVGRVQTPTLSLVVSRDREIEAFVPKTYYDVRAHVAHVDGTFSAKWKPSEDQAGLDSEGRLLDANVAKVLHSTLTGKDGRITEYKQETKTVAQPLAFSLSDLTVLASQKFGYSAEQVLDGCQALYETHKLTSYPRTDCGYLPESQHADAPSVLRALGAVRPDLASLIGRADTTIRSKTWNDSKVTAHHGIIPTQHAGDGSALSERERNLHDLIVRRYVAQFFPAHQYLATTVEITISSEVFVATGKVVTDNGWRDVLAEGEPEQRDETQPLPAMAQGQSVHCERIDAKEAKTKPPARFTEGTLIRAMENMHKWVDDPQLRKVLRDGDGIGTSATRAAILSDLKRREFVAARGKQLVSTQLGRTLVDCLPDAVKNPALTALYERMLQAIEAGKGTLGDFVAEVEGFVTEGVHEAASGALTIQTATPPRRGSTTKKRGGTRGRNAGR